MQICLVITPCLKKTSRLWKNNCYIVHPQIEIIGDMTDVDVSKGYEEDSPRASILKEAHSPEKSEDEVNDREEC